MNINLLSRVETLKVLPALFAQKTESLGAFRKKALEHLTVFAALGTIYFCQLKADSEKSTCALITIDLNLVWAFLKFVILKGWPLALIAYLDGTWRNKDSAHVFLAAYIATNAYWIYQSDCAVCMLSLPMRMFPYVLSALICHRIGSWLQPARTEE